MNLFQYKKKTIPAPEPVPEPENSPAKTYWNSNGEITLGCDVRAHLLIDKDNGGKPLKQSIQCFGVPVVIPPANAPKSALKCIAKQISAFLISIPEKDAPKWTDFPLDEILSHILYTGDNTDRPLRAAYRDSSGFLFSKSCIKYEHFTYHNTTGYTVEKENANGKS